MIIIKKTRPSTAVDFNSTTLTAAEQAAIDSYFRVTAPMPNTVVLSDQELTETKSFDVSLEIFATWWSEFHLAFPNARANRLAYEASVGVVTTVSEVI